MRLSDILSEQAMRTILADRDSRWWDMCARSQWMSDLTKMGLTEEQADEMIKRELEEPLCGLQSYIGVNPNDPNGVFCG